ncbi:hypothetical protein AB0I91_02015 [Actinosynnema sp. NPDC049800]
MFIRWFLGISVALLVTATPAAAHVVGADSDVRLAQTIGGVELTVVIRRTPRVPGPLHVDLVAHHPVRDLAIDIAVGDSAGEVLLRPDRAGTYPVVLDVRETGAHELRLTAAAESSALPFLVRVPKPATWELVVYGGFGATGLSLTAALVAGARSRRTAALALGGVGVVAAVVAATVGVMSPGLGAEQRDAGRPNAQAFLSTTPARPAVGEEFTLRFDLVDGSTGLPVDDLAVHHDALAHLVVTSRDGGFFRHLHPLRTAPGRVEVRLAADRPGGYLAHTEFERTDAGGQLVSGTFGVGADGTGAGGIGAGGIGADEVGTDEVGTVGVGAEEIGAVAADEPPGPATWTFPPGRPATIEVDTGSTGLQSWLGMAGHLIVRDEAGGFLGHVHERGSTSTSSDGTVAGHGPLLRFTVSFPRPGRYFAWLQYAEDFRVVTVPYVVEVGDTR